MTTRIPPMNELLQEGAARGLDRFGRPALHAALNQALDGVRERLRRAAPEQPAAAAGAELLGPAFWAQVEALLAVTPALGLRRAVNATGVILHTGLGRAPWPAEAAAAAVAASRYAVLEIDLESGERGRREQAVADKLRALTGAAAALAVNNNAAAVLLALSALARGRKVVLSRGQMVEIGGSYRMPEVVAAAGARLLEIGTTNRTHLQDYARALEDLEVGCVLLVHPSNFHMGGFVHQATAAELSPLCRAKSVPLVYDLGSGVLVGADLPAVAAEPTVRQALRDGCDLVTFSGDKLLGGPQAGLICGAAPLVERLRRDVLTRCLRLDKAILAALEATLAIHALGEDAARQRVPALRMLAVPAAVLKERAEALAAKLRAAAPELEVEVLACESRVGSGAAPVAPIQSYGVAIRNPALSAAELARRLRHATPPVFARVQGERVVLDLRTVAEGEEAFLLPR